MSILVQMRRCPECGYGWSWHLGDGRSKCRSCGTRYRVVSVWSASRLSYATKRKLVELFVYGVPGYRLRFRRIASAPTIERFFRQIRACCATEEQCREPFCGAVECDETTIGGYHPGKRGWGAAGKVIVLGILQRNGKVRVFPVRRRDKKEIIELVTTHTKPGSLYYTDDWQAYVSLTVRGDHIIVRKDQGKPRGRDHINGIEGFWSYAKHWLHPYRGVPKKFLHIYLGEICYRFNHRHEDLYPLILKLLHTTPITVTDSILVQIR